jgi:hypothetical protein
MTKLNRREFVQVTTAAAAALPKTMSGQAPTMMTPKSVKPVVVASSNGNKFKNGGTQTCVEKAFSFRNGDLFRTVATHPNLADISATDFGVLEAPTRVTHGLLAGVS